MKLRAFLFLILSALAASVLAAETAKIIRMTGAQLGTVYLPDNTEVPATAGLEVPVGTLIEVGADTKLFLRTFAGQITVAEAGSVFQIEEMVVTPENKEKTRINLKNGDLVANLDPNKRSTSDYGVNTPKGVAAARGTNYSVSVNGFTVLVTVSAGQVSFTIPNFPDPIPLNPGQATSGDSATASTLASVLTNPATAAVARAALRATAAAVATLAADPDSGVTNETVSQVVTTAGEASEATGDTTIVTEAAASAAAANPSVATTVVTAAVRSNPASANSVVTSVTNSATQSAAQTTTTTTGTTTTRTTTANTAAVQQLANTLASAANAALPTGSTQTVNANVVTQVVTQAQTTTVQSNTTSTPTTTTTTTTTTTQTPTRSETPVVVDVPTDNTVVTLFSTFTIRLSGGRLVAVTVNNRNAIATVRVVTAVEGTATTQEGNGASTAFTIPSQVTAVVGPITAAQLNNIAAGIRTALPGPTVTVPNNTITVSPSS